MGRTPEDGRREDQAVRQGKGVEGKAGERGGEERGAQRMAREVQTGAGSRMTPIRVEGAYLQNNPVTFLGSQVQRRLGHYLLSLPQRHVVEVPVVEGVPELLP